MSDDFFDQGMRIGCDSGDKKKSRDVEEQQVEEKVEEDPFAAETEEKTVEAEEDPFAEAGPAAVEAPKEDEFKFTREWNMKFRERCDEKDKEAMEKRKAVLKQAQEDMESWKEAREKKNESKAEMNREEEEKTIEGNKADLECANPWERVNKLVDMNAEKKHDMSRMKQVMIRMKNDAGKD